MAKSFVEVEKSGWGVTARKLAIALRASLTALGPLSFDDKRRVLKFLCDTFGIDATRL